MTQTCSASLHTASLSKKKSATSIMQPQVRSRTHATRSKALVSPTLCECYAARSLHGYQEQIESLTDSLQAEREERAEERNALNSYIRELEAERDELTATVVRLNLSTQAAKNLAARLANFSKSPMQTPTPSRSSSHPRWPTIAKQESGGISELLSRTGSSGQLLSSPYKEARVATSDWRPPTGTSQAYLTMKHSQAERGLLPRRRAHRDKQDSAICAIM
jgi:hypothetical protein